MFRTRRYRQKIPMLHREPAPKACRIAAAIIGNAFEWYDFRPIARRDMDSGFAVHSRRSSSRLQRTHSSSRIG
jgi:hypothetical protein